MRKLGGQHSDPAAQQPWLSAWLFSCLGAAVLPRTSFNLAFLERSSVICESSRAALAQTSSRAQRMKHPLKLKLDLHLEAAFPAA